MRGLLALFPVTILAVVAATQPAQAAMDGNMLLSVCEDSSAETGVCVGYILGVIDTQDWWAAREGQTCRIKRPANAPARQYIDVVLRTLREHPEKRHLPGTFLVTASLEEAFPCAQQ